MSDIENTANEVISLSYETRRASIVKYIYDQIGKLADRYKFDKNVGIRLFGNMVYDGIEGFSYSFRTFWRTYKLSDEFPNDNQIQDEINQFSDRKRNIIENGIEYLIDILTKEGSWVAKVAINNLLIKHAVMHDVKLDDLKLAVIRETSKKKPHRLSSL